MRVENFKKKMHLLLMLLVVFCAVIYSLNSRQHKPSVRDISGTYLPAIPRRDEVPPITSKSSIELKKNQVCNLMVPLAIQDGKSTNKLINIHGKWYLEQYDGRWEVKIEQNINGVTNFFRLDLLNTAAPYKLGILYDDPDMGKAILFTQKLPTP